MRNIISAVFEDRAQAEQAVTQMRSNGVPDGAISIVAQHQGETTATDAAGNKAEMTDHDDKASGTVKGLTIGAATGALFGLAAFFIPGVGPFVTAGALAETLGFAGGAAVSGAVVGGAAGGLAGALMDYGVNEEDARYYEQLIGQGGVLVTVDADRANIPADTVRQMLMTAGGRNSAYMA